MDGKKRKSKKIKILLAGGHGATTALTVVEELALRYNDKVDWDIHWVGSKSAMEGKKVPTLASRVLPRNGVKVHKIISGRIQRRITLWSPISFLKIPLSIFNALFLILKIRPDVVLSFGGHVGFPISLISWASGIPLIIHDQTYSFNRANRLSSLFATKIAISREASRKYYPASKTVLTGNPIMSRFYAVKPKKKIGILPTIYITGGSTGATSINSLVEEILSRLLGKYQVVHQTGYLDIDKYKKIQSTLSKKLADNYEVLASIDPTKVVKIFIKADIIVSRAGANTVSEIIATKRPSILIPLKIGKWNEQEKNARYAKKFGIAKILKQDKLSPIKLLKEINDTRRNWHIIVEKVRDKKSPDLDAPKKLVDLIEKLLD